MFPAVFSQVFFQLSSAFLRPQYLYSDLKLALARKYIASIWFSCFGAKKASSLFQEPVEPLVFERVAEEDTIAQYQAYLVPSNELFVFLSLEN